MSKFPTVNYVTYETPDLPGLGKVKFRPFLVGEHKQLLQATELGDPAAVLDTLASIVNACCFEKVNVGAVEMHLLDMLWLQIYMKSRGSVHPVSYTCHHEHNGKECGTKIQLNVPLDKAYISQPEGYELTSVIKLGDDSGIKLRQPTLEDYKKIRSAGKFDITDEFIFSSVDCIFDGDRVTTPGQDFSMAELAEYLGTLPDSIMQQITEFFTNSPDLCIDLDIKCPVCKNTAKLNLKGLDDFFV